MQTLEIFFDYVCPFCLQGHENLLALLPSAPQTELIWRPCEAHPRPERYGRHSDLLIQGMFFAEEKGVDLFLYHERMYRAAMSRQLDIENIDTLAAYVEDFLDAQAFIKALKEKKYLQVQMEANRYAYQQNGIWAVPSYRMDGHKLDAVENVGVSKKQLAKFIGVQ